MDPIKEEAGKAPLKMNVIVLAVNKDEADKLKIKVYDPKFSRMSVGYPDAKKMTKDVHAVVA